MIYFAQAGEFIKCGYATNVERRIALLQTANPLPISVLATCDGGRDVEAAFHRLMQPDLARGEWYHAHGETVQSAIDMAERGEHPKIEGKRSLRGRKVVLHRLDSFIRSRGLTQREVARQAGIHAPHLNAAILGNRKVSGRCMAALFKWSKGEITPDFFEQPSSERPAA